MIYEANVLMEKVIFKELTVMSIVIIRYWLVVYYIR